MKVNGEYGEDLWERKIKVQGEVGVIAGSLSTLTKINDSTKRFIKFFDKNISPLIKKNARILDLGVGPMARFSIEFAKRGYIVTGLDISKTTLDYAKKYILKSGEDIRLIKDDITKFSERDNKKYDLIICINTFYHIPPHLSGISLMKMNKLLRKGGYCLIGFGLKKKRKLKDLPFRFLYWTGHYLKSLFGLGFRTNITAFKKKEIKEIIDCSLFKIKKIFPKGIYLIKK